MPWKRLQELEDAVEYLPAQLRCRAASSDSDWTSDTSKTENHECSRESDGSDSEDLNSEIELLGSEEDKIELVELVNRFRRDDLAGDGDRLIAAIRMQVHMITRYQMALHILFSCGLWVLFKPREDYGVLLLTGKGRIIKYGKGQEANPDVVWHYLEKLCVTALLLLLAASLLICALVYYFNMTFQRWLIVVSCGSGVLLIFSIYLYAQRPRRDCGATFRQYFSAQKLNAATYVRADQGRQLRTLCKRRRQGHLRMFFGQYYPQVDEINEGLPTGAPSAGNICPSNELPHAMAGEQQVVRRNVVDMEGRAGKERGLTVRLTAFLAMMGLIGFYYDISTFFVGSAQDQLMCRVKRRGCRWSVDNQPWFGKQRTIPGTNPPWNGQRCKRDKYDTQRFIFCDRFYQRHDFCMESSDENVHDFRLNCSKLRHLRDALRKSRVFDSNGDMLVTYVTHKDMSLRAEPDALYPWGRTEMIDAGMTLTRIGDVDSTETRLLQQKREVSFATSRLRKRCEGPRHNGAIRVTLKNIPDTEMLDDEDCLELQEACLAESFGPKNWGWWPPTRLFNGDYDRALCAYFSYKAPWQTKRWNVVDEQEIGRTCHGQPIAQPSLWEVRHDSNLKKIEKCKQACEEKTGCAYAFVGRKPSKNISSMQLLNMPRCAKESLNLSDVCWLYAQCPANVIHHQKNSKTMQAQLIPTPCGQPCNSKSTNCAALAVAFRTSVRIAPVQANTCRRCSLHGCRSACLVSSGHVLWCNGFAYSAHPLADGSVHHTCIIYGPEDLQPPFGESLMWERIESNSRIDTKDERVDNPVPVSNVTSCFVRLWPLPANRARAARPGVLLHYSDKPSCAGCWTRSVSDFFTKTPSNVASVLTNLVTMLGLLYIARSAHHRVQTRKVVFTGKPMVDMVVAEDAANPTGFEERERAYLRFARLCFEIAQQTSLDGACGNVDQGDSVESSARKAFGHVDDKVHYVTARSFDEYEPSDLRRKCCYLDRELLGLLSDERVLHCWCDQKLHGIIHAIWASFGVVAFGVFISYFLPWETCRKLVMRALAVLVPAGLLYHYFEIRREEQVLGCLTNQGRAIQYSRQPPRVWFLPWHGGVSFRLDVFQVGEIYLAQLDMPTAPLSRDKVKAVGLERPWRRGSVAIRCSHGVLQMKRHYGEILDVYLAITELAKVKAKLDPSLRPVASFAGAEVDGFSTSDLLLRGEGKVWEKKLDAYGFLGDPFNYMSVLTITDHRIIVSRARKPKPLSVMGIITGPLTMGSWFKTLQEWRGTHAYITVTSISHEGVESYVTTRVRSPPFWPGFMAPRTSLSLTFLVKYMNIYPAGLFVTQRPYGIALKVRLRNDGATLGCSATKTGGSRRRLVILSTSDPKAPRGHFVTAVWNEVGKEISLGDRRWFDNDGFHLPPGSTIHLEPADPEWNTYADEPWLRQVRLVLDHVIGHSTAPEDAWVNLEKPPARGPSARVKAKSCKFAAALCGSDCLGHRFDPVLVEDDDAYLSSDEHLGSVAPLISSSSE